MEIIENGIFSGNFHSFCFIGFLWFSKQEFRCFHSHKTQNHSFTLTQKKTLKVSTTVTIKPQ